ncbi:hypothetical protein CRM22_006796 [Opisthorchis felineus]|uniref:Uncharacterized protein n=1 Tax=Opisthorchis felineus TaxID=147828 RepID=A0A4S2LJ72_OPIFE|nr:hypothetical protein CRM22_006796 [Opisthorchis felineus]
MPYAIFGFHDCVMRIVMQLFSFCDEQRPNVGGTTYGSEASVLNTDVMLTMMMMVGGTVVTKFDVHLNRVSRIKSSVYLPTMDTKNTQYVLNRLP